jgi:Leucine-rich repeat (LRR) protein
MIIDKDNYKEYLLADGKIIYCSNRNITEIRYLPKGIEELYCDGNELTLLPKLPVSLKVLYCHNNRLTSLPKLPNSLERLFCGDNRLTTLPELPESLRVLHCMGNNELAIQGNYYSKQEINEYKDKLKRCILINQILEKL